MTLFTDFDEVRADVVNVVPPQQAAAIAARAGVVDATGWCPVDPVSFASRLQPDVHVIGDAIIGAPMPKSAFSANAQAKVCAIQVARQLAGQHLLFVCRRRCGHLRVGHVPHGWRCLRGCRGCRRHQPAAGT
jgi:hypothetical protein